MLQTQIQALVITDIILCSISMNKTRSQLRMGDLGQGGGSIADDPSRTYSVPSYINKYKSLTKKNMNRERTINLILYQEQLDK